MFLPEVKVYPLIDTWYVSKLGSEGGGDPSEDIRLFLSTKGVCVFLLSLSKFFSSKSSVLTKAIVLLKGWGGAVVGQSEVALSCYKGGSGM